MIILEILNLQCEKQECNKRCSTLRVDWSGNRMDKRKLNERRDKS